MAEGRKLKGNKELEPSIIKEAREELKRRSDGGRRGARTAPAEHHHPPEGASAGAPSGNLSLYNWLRKGGTEERESNPNYRGSDHKSMFGGFKTHNKYDMHTWRKGLLDQWSYQKHASLAPPDVRKRYHAGTTTDADRKHLLREADGHLFSAELERRGRQKEPSK